MSIGSMHGVLDDDNDLFVSEVSAAHAEPTKGVSAKQLSKLWKIDLESAERTLKITSQRRKHDSELSLSRNLSTHDRMLSCGHTCMQLFVSDKGFVFVVPMKSKGVKKCFDLLDVEETDRHRDEFFRFRIYGYKAAFGICSWLTIQSEFTAIKQHSEYVRSLRYKL